VRIRPAQSADAPALTAIYEPYVVETPISLETDPPTVEAMVERIAAGADLHPWLVAEDEGRILGYAYASRFRPRPGYRFTVETSVYVAPDRQRRGIARALYAPLIETLIAQGFTQAIAAITLPNAASVALHEVCGFRKCGVYGQVGWKLGLWWDVGLWQRCLAETLTPPRELLPLSGLAASGTERP
jgi:L-amino acid N-acyltransferase YncA